MLSLKFRMNRKVIKFLSCLVGTLLLVVIVAGNLRITTAATPSRAVMTLSQASSESSDENQIREVVTEELKKGSGSGVIPKIERVFRADNYAIADWILGESGGQAVLAKQQNNWKLLAPGGGALSAGYLQKLGIPEQQTQQLMHAINNR